MNEQSKAPERIAEPMSMHIHRAEEKYIDRERAKIINEIEDYVRRFKRLEMKLNKMKRCLDRISKKDIMDYVNGESLVFVNPND